MRHQAHRLIIQFRHKMILLGQLIEWFVIEDKAMRFNFAILLFATNARMRS